jgi:uncharacterized protein YqjF (DUF2071 family)
VPATLDLLEAPARQIRALEQLAHRPWPLPRGAWTMAQTWDDLLFAHWRVPVEAVRPYVPRALELDTHDGSAWIGITPFRVNALRLRGLPPLPRLSAFLELNVRTYVTTGDRPGIWFFSLDASSTLAVEAARRMYRLPYFRARIEAVERAGWIDYECSRTEEPGRVWSGRYRPAGDVSSAAPGSLEWFLAERYCLYTTDRHGALLRAEIHHGPWPLQPAEASVDLTTISRVALPASEAPLCHFSRRQDALIWPLEPVR